MSRSSIFNFDTWQGWKRIPKGLICALALLLVVEVVLVRTGWMWDVNMRSHTGVITCMEREVIAPASAPVVIVMGNSRARDAFSPRLLEHELHLHSGAVLNLAINAGMPFDSLAMYRNNRESLSNADVLVVDCEAWYLAQPHPLTSRIMRYASLDERCELFAGTPSLLPSVAGFFWQTYGAQEPIHGLPAILWNEKYRRTVPIGVDGRLVWREAGDRDTGPADCDTNEFVKRFTPYAASAVQFKPLRELIAIAEQDGLKVAVVGLPVRDAAIRAAKKRIPDIYGDCRNRLGAITQSCDNVLIYESASDADIPDQYFYDYGHMTRLGAQIMTRRLAGYLKSRQLLDREAAEADFNSG